MHRNFRWARSRLSAAKPLGNKRAEWYDSRHDISDPGEDPHGSLESPAYPIARHGRPGAALVVSSLARADAAKPSAEEILKMMEATNNSYADQTLRSSSPSSTPTVPARATTSRSTRRGRKRLVEFTSARSRACRCSSRIANSVYVYLPGFKKVRRVAASNMNQTIVGSDLSNDDMATVSWADGFVPTLDKEDDTSWWLALTPKAAARATTARSSTAWTRPLLQQETHYYNKAGEEVKRLICSSSTNFDGITRYKTRSSRIRARAIAPSSRRRPPNTTRVSATTSSRSASSSGASSARPLSEVSHVGLVATDSDARRRVVCARPPAVPRPPRDWVT